MEWFFLRKKKEFCDMRGEVITDEGRDRNKE